MAAALESALEPTVTLVEEEGRRIGRRSHEPFATHAPFPSTEGCARLVAVRGRLASGESTRVSVRAGHGYAGE